jgi:hypothetical protein
MPRSIRESLESQPLSGLVLIDPKEKSTSVIIASLAVAALF